MNRIIAVEPLFDYLLKLSFADGSEKVVDIEPFIGKGISAELRDPEFFQQVDVESGGGIYWPNGYDFCPNFLYDEVPAFELSLVHGG
jgi:hypothetical protein